jgi:hypothetical protein
MRNDENFLSDIAKGMMPRRFQSDHINDRVIYEEDQEVAEMYFVQSGFDILPRSGSLALQLINMVL